MSTRRPWDDHDARTLRALYPHVPTQWVARVLARSLLSTYEAAGRARLRKTPAYLASPYASRLRPGDNPGWAHRFRPGHVPANKGKKVSAEVYAKCQPTMFKKGTWSTRNAAMYLPIGTQRVGTDGYLEQKITDAGRAGQRWRCYHRIVWEAAHGPIPAGHVVAFKPGRFSTDPALITHDALELLTRQDNLARNSLHRLPKELVRVMQLRGALTRQINRKKREPA